MRDAHHAVYHNRTDPLIVNYSNLFYSTKSAEFLVQVPLLSANAETEDPEYVRRIGCLLGFVGMTNSSIKMILINAQLVHEEASLGRQGIYGGIQGFESHHHYCERDYVTLNGL